ncbi:MAG TPA: hypothetical protein VIL30_14520 [Ramlibacter sp.]|jgi:hypothetical protein
MSIIEMPMDTADKVRENKARRAAIRQGLELQKSKRRDPRAIDFGGYMLVDLQRNFVVFGGDPHAFSASLEQIEQYLNR